MNVTNRMQQQITKTIRREDENLLILNTIVTDLNNIKDIIDFMTYTKDGVILTNLSISINVSCL